MNEAHVIPAAGPGDLPPWVARQAQHLAQQPGHAWLLHGASGLGQYELALRLATTWLCEAPGARPCGQCAGCHGVAVRAHADLRVLMPEVTLIEHGWPLDEKAQKDIDAKERKPSREIRIEAIRDAIDFAQRTSARGGTKVIVVYPAERMNVFAANALLKTLEEPPGDTRFVLATEAVHALAPTIRSRCMQHAMQWPRAAEGMAWLQGQGVSSADTESLWRASGGRPETALALRGLGCDAQAWRQIPGRVARGQPGVLADWPMARVLDALQKVCHDLQVRRAGGMPRFFEVSDLPAVSAQAPLHRWSAELQHATRTVEHPVQAGLQLEALLAHASRLLRGGSA